MELLEFILTTTYFTFRGQIYKQEFGTAMGSPVSPLVANNFIESLEQKLKLLATAPEDLSNRNCGRHSGSCPKGLSGQTHRISEYTG